MCDRCAKCDHSTSVNGYWKKLEGCETYIQRQTLCSKPEHNVADWMNVNICFQIKTNKNISDFLGIRR